MKIKKQIEVEVRPRYLNVIAPVRYEDEDIRYDAPGRKGDLWQARIDVVLGKIVDWPGGELEIFMKVTDSARFELYDEDGSLIHDTPSEGDYVPRFMPDEWGDYIKLDIAADGTVRNWKPSQFEKYVGDWINGE